MGGREASAESLRPLGGEVVDPQRGGAAYNLYGDTRTLRGQKEVERRAHLQQRRQVEHKTQPGLEHKGQRAPEQGNLVKLERGAAGGALEENQLAGGQEETGDQGTTNVTSEKTEEGEQLEEGGGGRSRSRSEGEVKRVEEGEGSKGEKRPVSDCRVCGDRAIAHMHYGGICCYSCKVAARHEFHTALPPRRSSGGRFRAGRTRCTGARGRATVRWGGSLIVTICIFP